MICVSIVEDDPAAAEQLTSFLKEYSQKNNVLFHSVIYSNAETFLKDYKSDVDIVFMDIELPDMNGMEAAAKLRDADKLVIIVFVTNMQQFAAKGYAVGAADFIVKPMSYYAFSTMLDRVLRTAMGNKSCELTIRGANEIYRVSPNNVSYIEVRGHKLIYHTESGTIESWGSLRDLEQRPELRNFVRGNSCYLINLRYVYEVSGCNVQVSNETITLSRQKRKEFVRRLNEFLGER